MELKSKALIKSSVWHFTQIRFFFLIISFLYSSLRLLFGIYGFLLDSVSGFYRIIASVSCPPKSFN